MSHLPYVFLVSWTCLAAAFAPTLGGTVFCTTPGGHQAIEVAHPFTNCAATERHDMPAEQEPEHCDDRLISTADLMCQGRGADVAVTDFGPSLWSCVLLHQLEIGLDVHHFVITNESPPPSEELLRLATVVLLI